MIILITICICTGIIILFNYWLFKRKKAHAISIETDWIKFNKAITNNHIEGIHRFGKELIYNEHFSMVKLKEKSKLIKRLEEQNPELMHNHQLKNLKSLLYNKHLDWKTKYP